MSLREEISSVVNWDSPSVDLQDNLRTVIQKLVANKSSALVVKSNNEVVGIVTDMDIMQCIDNSDDIDTTPVSKFMTSCDLITAKTAKSPCVQLDVTESIENALGVMNRAGIHNLMVSGEGNKVGVVSARDLLEKAIH